MKSIFVVSLVFLLKSFSLLTSLEFPLNRNFKNCNLTFKNNESLVLEINDQAVNFFIIADQGGIGTPPYVTNILTYVASLMGKLSVENNTHFQFALGDNFYNDGVTNLEDTRFQDTFENVFNHQNLINTPWFMALGNHDYRGKIIEGNVTAQIEYTYKSKRWILPNYLYDIDIMLNKELLIKAIVIDTQLICSEGSESEKELYFNKVEGKIKEFSKTNASYYIVLGHFPVWSAGVKGSNECLNNKLRPVIHKYGVDAYFCGDDHIMQHITDTYLNKTVEHIVSGATTNVVDDDKNRNNLNNTILNFFWKARENGTMNCDNCPGAIAFAKVDKKKFDLRFINTNGVEIHSFSINSRKSSNSSAKIATIANGYLNLLLLLILNYLKLIF